MREGSSCTLLEALLRKMSLSLKGWLLRKEGVEWLWSGCTAVTKLVMEASVSQGVVTSPNVLLLSQNISVLEKLNWKS